MMDVAVYSGCTPLPTSDTTNELKGSAELGVPEGV